MRRMAWISMIAALLLMVSVVASANIYGGVERRQQLAEENQGFQQGLGDQGGTFTAALNATQPIYYVYDWDMNFVSLGRVVGSAGSGWAYPGSGYGGSGRDGLWGYGGSGGFYGS